MEFEIFDTVDLTRLHEMNQLKREMQELMPEVRLLQVRPEPDSLAQFNRDQGLRGLGYSDQQIESVHERDRLWFEKQREQDLESGKLIERNFLTKVAKTCAELDRRQRKRMKTVS